MPNNLDHILRGFSSTDSYNIVKKSRDAWRKLAKAQSKLLAAFRIGKQPSEKTLEALSAAKATLDMLGETL